VISDEIYGTIVYDNKKHYCIANFSGIKEKAITINSFSKNHAISSWRIDHMIAPKEIIRNIMKIIGYNFINLLSFNISLPIST
jgi:aspartate/methionine/tyrosine aminotransferase